MGCTEGSPGCSVEIGEGEAEGWIVAVATGVAYVELSVFKLPVLFSFLDELLQPERASKQIINRRAVKEYGFACDLGVFIWRITAISKD